jgi:hypothetical protein
METPIGMIAIHTRRAGDNVWVHVNDFIPPNIHQFPPTWEDAKSEKRFQRPLLTNWSVPVDDTHTLSIGMRHMPKKMPEVRRNAQQESIETRGFGFGQTGDRPYEERQRIPGDYDAQTSQRSIAVHALEHLGTTDRGVVMLRRIVRKGIQAVQRGEDPPTLKRDGKVVPTYSNDTILRIPRTGSDEDDRKLLLETGRKVCEEYLRNHPKAPTEGVPA